MQDAINNDYWASLATAEVALQEAQEQLHEIKSEAQGEGIRIWRCVCRCFRGDLSSGNRSAVSTQYFFSALEAQLAA